MKTLLGELLFSSDFDSGNLESISSVANAVPNVLEFNATIAQDCAGTSYINENRTWFYFSVVGGRPGLTMVLNLVNMNNQARMYAQGFSPVTRCEHKGKLKLTNWERLCTNIHTEPNATGITLSFAFRFSSDHGPESTTFFAFSYPFSLEQNAAKLLALQAKFAPPHAPCKQTQSGAICSCHPNTIYLYREVLTRSQEGRAIELLTISSCDGIDAYV